MAAVKEICAARLGGWIPDIPDPRDRSLDLVPEPLHSALANQKRIDASVDLREYFSEPEDQCHSQATVAFSCGALIEYFRRRCLGRISNVLKPFLYETTRRLHGIEGDCGISIRQALKTLSRVGVPPATCRSPGQSLEGASSLDPLLFAFARDYRNLQYFRVDTPTIPAQKLLDDIRRLLQLGIPLVFGMPLLSSWSPESRIDYYDSAEVIGGTAGVFVGFDDHRRNSSRGALLFRSTWGPIFGEHGHGWLSYRFIEHHLVRDVWVVFDPQWATHGDLPFGA